MRWSREQGKWAGRQQNRTWGWHNLEYVWEQELWLLLWVQKKGQNWWRRDWSTSSVRKGWERWDCSAWKWEGLGESHQCLYILERKVQRGQSLALFSAQWRGKRQWAHSGMQEVLSEHQKALYYGVMEHWHRLPTKIVEIFRRCLGMVLGYLL